MKKLTVLVHLAALLSLAGCAICPQPAKTTPVSRPPQINPPATVPAPSASSAASESAATATEPSAASPTEPADDALVRVLRFIPTARQYLPYATPDNFTGQTIYDFTDAYLRYGTVKRLKGVCDELAQQGIGILIWDGFRPVSAQNRLWEICPDITYVSPPNTGYRAHCRGSAVDVTLVDLETGVELKMPTGFDDFTGMADRDYSDCPADAAANAVLLEETMKKYGFQPYVAEWWHFSDPDEYPIEETFEPGVG